MVYVHALIWVLGPPDLWSSKCDIDSLGPEISEYTNVTHVN